MPRPSPTAILALQLASHEYLRGFHFLPRMARSCRLSSHTRPAVVEILHRTAIRALWGLALVHLLYFGVVTLTLAVWKCSDPALTSLMIFRQATYGTRIKPIRFLPLAEITQGTRNAFIQLEDHDFYTHWGISPEAIRDAIAINRQVGRTVYGASTITQQLARTLFLTPDRNWLRKYLEAGTAVLMELILGKARIFELYLNCIEFGPGIFGLGAAAYYHYGVPYAALSYDQRIRLAVIITSPLRYSVETMWNNRGMVARYQALTGAE